MKKIFLILNLFTFFSFNAQEQDLFALSTGTFTGLHTVIDNNDDLYGYITIYDKGKIDDEAKSFEAILLDTNLNKVANLSFDAGKYVSGYDVYMNINDEIILDPLINYYLMGGAFYLKAKKFVHPEAVKIDFKKKTTEVYKTYCYTEEGELEECSSNKSWRDNKKEQKKERKDKGYNFESHVYRLKDKNYLINEYEKHKLFYNNENLQLFDSDQQFKWKYVVENNGSKKNGYKTIAFYRINLENNNGVAYFKLLSIKYNQTKKIELIGIDIKTGKELFKQDLTDKLLGITSKSLSRTEIDKYIVDVTKLYGKRGKGHIGFRRMKLNMQTNKIEWHDLLFEDMKNNIDRLNKFGKIGGNYLLRAKASFVNKDGSVYILTEEYKMAQNMLTNQLVPKNKSFFLIQTDENFNLSDVHKIYKDKSKRDYSDFLFWQKLDKENKDISFFYEDKRKDEVTGEKQWLLGVCTIINGEFKNEEIPISSKSKESHIIPLRAKRGYIIIREYDEEDNYNIIRLEKLNY